MVYQGKPSRGCQMCRTRRIKCDETKPTCKQCAKSRRQCPGYKDEFDLVFRNETAATERRAQRASKKALAHKISKESGPSSSDSSSPTSSLSSASSSYGVSILSSLASLTSRSQPSSWSAVYSLSRQPQLTMDDRAACHFISNYVLIPQQGNTRGFLEYVIPLLKAEEVSPHFKAAFEACAMTTLANHSHPAPDLEKLAVQKYTNALSATQRALQNADTFKQDATLASILLLGLFENLTSRHLGMLAWGSHIEGAIQLVKNRGRKQLRTKTGVALFIAVRTQMIIHTLSTAKPPVMNLKWWVNEDSVRDQYASQCQKLNIRAGEIRAEVNRLMNELPRTLESIEVMQEMIRKAQDIDHECVKWAQSLPESFQCRTVAWEDNVPHGDYGKAEVCPGRVDAYPDLWVASVWNMMRCSRIIMASIVVRCVAWACSPVDYRTTPEYAAATRICVENITDIIASVPYQLGWFSRRKHLLQQDSLSGFACGQEDTPKSLSGYFLTWPLACIYGQDYTTDSQRAWVKGRLVYIGTRLGVRYALMLSELHVRAPSMLIRRDGLVATQSTNFEKLLSTKPAHPRSGSLMSPTEQLHEALQRDMVERQKAELADKVMGSSSIIDEWTAKI